MAATPPPLTAYLGPQQLLPLKTDLSDHRIGSCTHTTPKDFQGLVRLPESVPGCSFGETLLPLGLNLGGSASQELSSAPAAADINTARWRHLEAAACFTLLYHRFPEKGLCQPRVPHQCSRQDILGMEGPRHQTELGRGPAPPSLNAKSQCGDQQSFWDTK